MLDFKYIIKKTLFGLLLLLINTFLFIYQTLLPLIILLWLLFYKSNNAKMILSISTFVLFSSFQPFCF